MTRNAEVASLLEEFADRLEATGVEYKPRAYRRAAENIRDQPASIAALAADDRLDEIDGVGDAIASKISEYLETGAIGELEDAREEMPVDIEALTAVEGLGPKRVGALYDALGVEDLDDLESVAAAGRIRAVEGFGPKTEQNILDGIPFAREAHERARLGDAYPVGREIRDALATNPNVERVELAGSLRRWTPTVGDVDVLASGSEPRAVVEAFTDLQADGIIEAGETKASLRLDDLRVDLRVVVPDEFGSALQYFTGSWDHNVTLRNRAIERGLKMNEYGLFDVSGVDDAETAADPAAGDTIDNQRVGERIAGDTEASMYEALDLEWITPELREARGEVDAAAADSLPTLLEIGDIRGDLHVHSDWSDGAAGLADMVSAAAAVGHEYVALTDHATGPGMVGGVGLSDADLRDQLVRIRELDDDSDITVLAGVEANIDTEGALSVGEDVLADLDLVVASPHSDLDGDGTDRLVSAIEHPAVSVLGHPTGRLINQRSGLEVDLDRIATHAAEHEVALEVNSNPARLDLSGQAVRIAVEAGAPIAVNTDAHRPASFDLLTYGVHTARRGWAEPADVLNTWSIADLRDIL